MLPSLFVLFVIRSLKNLWFVYHPSLKKTTEFHLIKIVSVICFCAVFKTVLDVVVVFFLLFVVCVRVFSLVSIHPFYFNKKKIPLTEIELSSQFQS